ncbi:transglutaminase-like domain-containing protein [Fusibacter tunisiensis]|uniref:Transglutaminase-like putative cysteine protease n=1 Tax=Fusibacter tunisiensis TaxID=1008308 RepID=A0ABS2MNI8_9FIRM|nr:transglutaminase-like domain-containing protein [Fusibacter tunisiensis]MBM7560959.1 transglutaminase-like putative cysteine protease [Fusibacter tunisiensis]
MSRNVYKWLPGLLIVQALFWVAVDFIPFGLTGLNLLSVSICTYLGLLVLIRYRKHALYLFAGLAGIVVLTYLADAGASFYADWREVAYPFNWLIDFRAQLDYGHLLRYIEWLMNRTDLPGNTPYELIFAGAVSAGITLAFMVTVRFKPLKILWIGPLFFFIVMWYRYVSFSWGIYLTYFSGLFAMLIMEVHEYFVKSHSTYDGTHHPTWKVYVYGLSLSVLLIFFTNALYIMTPHNAIRSGFDAVIPNVWGARTDYNTDNMRIYALWNTPYQNDPNALGGPVGPMNREDPLFWVTMADNAPLTLYLKTNVKSIYTGKNWQNPKQVFKNRFANYRATPENIKLLETGDHKTLNGTLEMDLLKTTTLIAPMGTYETSLDPEKIFTSTENEGFFKAGLLARNLKSYTFAATGMDFGFPEDADYLQLPEGIDSRTFELAESLGRLGKTDYEKAVAMTRFLIDNYTYELAVPTFRTNEDFVSAFLFETQEGYCTYFASALTVMARINRIPARYVEGFRVDTEAFVKGSGRAKVTEADAHAWTELYLDGYGWVIFESTPPYSGPLETDYSPGLSDLLEPSYTEGDPENDLPGSTEAVDESQFLIERDGGRPDIETVYAGPGETASMPLPVKISLAVLAALMLAASVYLIKVPYTFYKGGSKHTLAARRLHTLLYLIRLNRDNSVGRAPEHLFRLSDVFPEVIENWLKVLYDRKDRVKPEMLDETLDSVKPHLKTQLFMFKKRKGIFKYWFLILYKIPHENHDIIR